MIYITQLIYIHEKMEAVFEEFEQMAMPLISKYNGKLLLRLRPDGSALIGGEMEKPYERKRFLHLKEQSVRTSIMIQSLPCNRLY
jgi:hypothetical protein